MNNCGRDLGLIERRTEHASKNERMIVFVVFCLLWVDGWLGSVQAFGVLYKDLC